jgi:hypothetical protein
LRKRDFKETNNIAYYREHCCGNTCVVVSLLVYVLWSIGDVALKNLFDIATSQEGVCAVIHHHRINPSHDGGELRRFPSHGGGRSPAAGQP